VRLGSANILAKGGGRLKNCGARLGELGNCFGSRRLNDVPTAQEAAMHLHTYRDESRSRHFDLIGAGGHPWSIDLVAVTAAGLLVGGFACAVVALWVR
jgi:hypothetical protein